MDSFKLSVIIPVYNEVVTLREILRRVVRAPFAKEVLVVDDGSTDGTTRILKDTAALKAFLFREPVPAPFELKVFFP